MWSFMGYISVAIMFLGLNFLVWKKPLGGVTFATGSINMFVGMVCFVMGIEFNNPLVLGGILLPYGVVGVVAGLEDLSNKQAIQNFLNSILK